MFCEHSDSSRPLCRRRASSPQLWGGLLGLVLCWSLYVGSHAATVVISQLPPGVHDTQLLEAFQNKSVTTILLASDYALGTQFDNFSGPYQSGSPLININRNITVSSMPNLDPAPMLDFQFKLYVLQLCDDCWFNMVNISVKDERMGANAQFDFFMGEGNSVITATNVVRNRRSCTDIDTALGLVRRTKRASRFLYPYGTDGSNKQVVEAANLVWRGEVFPHTLHLQNYSVEFPKHYNGGYAVVLHNVWRLCHTAVDPSCLIDKDADMCVFAEIQRQLAGRQGQREHGMSSGAIAAIVTAVVTCVLVALAVAALIAYRRHQRRSQQHHGLKSTLPPTDPELGGGMAPPCCDVAALRDSETHDKSHGHHRSGIRHASPKGGGGGGSGGYGGGGGGSGGHGGSTGYGGYGGSGGYGGDSTALLGSAGRDSSTSSLQAAYGRSQPPLPGSTASITASLCNVLSELHFSHVLGTGSFGRVYKARLGDCDVAVKVIEHDSRMSASVENEVALMLSCKHPNVVYAYHYVTHNHKQEGNSDASFDRVAGPGSSRPATLRSDPPAPPETPACSAQSQPGSASSTEQRLCGSNNSMDVPIPVLPGPKVSRSSCPACERDVWPSVGQGPQGSRDDALTISGSTRGVPNSSSNSSNMVSSSSAATPVSNSPGGHGLQSSFGLLSEGSGSKCTCTCSNGAQQQQQQPLSGLLAWQHEGGFWPAGPSALLEQQHVEDEQAQEELHMATTWLIQEFCDSGTLSKQANSWLPSTEDDKQMIKRLLLLQDVVKGLSYLHGKNVVHGDLNARNVLVTTSITSPCGLMAKLADLGLSRTIKQHNTHHTTCTVGTMSHMPPELLRHGHMSPAVDVYAFGIMMWEVYTREIAFRELHYGQFFETVVLRDQRPPVPLGMPEDYRVLMEHCWSAEPSARPSTKALLECIGLMIADRQHSLGLPVRSSVDLVDREYGKHGSSDGADHKAIMRQLAMQFQQQQQQQQPLQQQQAQQAPRHQRAVQRQATPARLPVAHRQQPQQHVPQCSRPAPLLPPQQQQHAPQCRPAQLPQPQQQHNAPQCRSAPLPPPQQQWVEVVPSFPSSSFSGAAQPRHSRDGAAGLVAACGAAPAASSSDRGGQCGHVEASAASDSSLSGDVFVRDL